MKSFPIAVFVLTVALATICPAQEQDLKVTKDSGKNPWTNLAINNDPKNFQFAIVTDRTGGHRPGVFEDAVAKLNLLQPEFVMSVGDLIEGYTKDVKEIERQWDEFQSFTAKLKMPFFYVPGNHDLSNEVLHDKWKERFGRKYYHFVYRDVLFLCLNSEDPVRRISSEQVEYVKKALGENRGVRWTLVFFHQPLWIHEDRAEETARDEKPIGWAEVEQALLADDRKFTVFAGHLHNYTKHVRNDRRYIVLASTGGGSKLRGIPFGEFDHVAWVTMTDEGPLMANLMLSGIGDEDVTTDQSRKRVAHLVEAARVVAPIIETDSTTLGGAVRAQVKLINDADVPLTVAGRFAQNDRLRPDPYAIDAVVPPNSVKLVDVTLTPREPGAKVIELAPVALDLTMSYAMPKGPKLEMRRALSVGVDHPIPIASRVSPASPIVVDGKLGEWGELPVPCIRPAQVRGDTAAWKNTDDASFRFGVAADEQNLYVGIDATDERVMLLEGRTNAPAFDGVELRIDARPAAARKQRGASSDVKQQAYIAVCPGDESGKGTFIDPAPTLPPGTRAVSAKTARGYTVEIAVPLDYVRKMAGSADWKDVRINIVQNDRDDTAATLAELWWRPYWLGDEDYPESGTFRRE